MNVLVVADEESRSLWDFFTPDKLKDIDLIISCGDLKSEYLQFLVTLGSCPLVYIHGNHDSRYDQKPPEGCICIEDMIYNYRGLRIAGLGGSMRYKEGPNMYSEKEMSARARHLQRKIRSANGIDILVAHAPARGYGDMEDLPHNGFECFNGLLMKYRPLYFLHGHVHKSYGHGFERKTEHPSGTAIINAYESYVLRIPDSAYPDYGKTGAFLYDLRCRLSSEFRILEHNPF